jgi:hypothetical protein
MLYQKGQKEKAADEERVLALRRTRLLKSGLSHWLLVAQDMKRHREQAAITHQTEKVVHNLQIAARFFRIWRRRVAQSTAAETRHGHGARPAPIPARPPHQTTTHGTTRQAGAQPAASCKRTKHLCARADTSCLTFFFLFFLYGSARSDGPSPPVSTGCQ